MNRIRCSLLSLIFIASSIFSFGSNLNEPLPIDPKVRIGKLDNGFTYYLRENQKPENRVEMRLAVNVGSIVEDDDQQGLAHFVEHMAFNGSTNFDKNELISYLQSIGVDFGPDLNAYTSFDETVYMLTIPSDKSELVDKGFLVMQDWAQGLTLSDEEIENERGVIIEEWRIGRGAGQRMLDKYLPVLFYNSHYADRLPIGKIEILENFDFDVLRRYYYDWYRPDLMAFIMVGDFDLDQAEEQVVAHFSGLTMPEDPRPRERFGIPDHEETLVVVATDEEAPNTAVQINFKHESSDLATGADYLDAVKLRLFSAMLNQRLSERAQEGNPPFIFSSFRYSSLYSPEKDTFSGYALVSDTDIASGFQAMMEEAERVRRFGFTQSELDRAKLNSLNAYERAYAERDKTESSSYIQEYIDHYLENDPIPGIEFKYEFVKEHLVSVDLESVNALAEQLITAENRVIVVTGPESAQANISEDQLLAIVDEVGEMEIAAYEDALAGSELITEMPEPGEVISTELIDVIKAEKWTLSNGVEVYLKHTNYKNDQVLIQGFSDGGTSLYPDEDFTSAVHAGSIADLSGVGDFTEVELTKLLAGKIANVGTSIRKYGEAVSGSARPQDLETMFQLLYLHFTDPKFNEDAFNSYVSRWSAYLKNRLDDPNAYFQDQYARILQQHHPRGDYFPRVEDFAKIDHKRAHEIYLERFSDADDFTFVIVGNFDVSALKPFIEQYLASLPRSASDESYVDLGIRPPSGYQLNEIFRGEDEKSSTYVNFSTPADYIWEDSLHLQALSRVLDIRYQETLREEMSDVYSVGVSANFGREPYDRATLRIRMPSSPDSVEGLVDSAISIIEEIRQNGPSEENVEKVKEIMRRNFEKSLEENSFWLGGIANYVEYDKDFNKLADISQFDLITAEGIQKVARKYFDTESYIQTTLYPAAMKPENQ